VREDLSVNGRGVALRQTWEQAAEKHLDSYNSASPTSAVAPL